ncbi:MAG: hypothetical protein Q8922_14655 [Bacteroidota bacterium]|nr:hypothetical protein [Bacteroidota bacterium]MDP4234267.1 hypothetical protein [Bacteroidota bacterium]MDP4243457.1 hypothetical protein [Bacteroidota bacterium]MDP4289159.1 hypothetical protein [Bacteroidota bacterium]
MKRYLTGWSILLLLTLALTEVAPQAACGRKLKIYSLPKEIAPGQLGMLIFENPNPALQKSESKCIGERLPGWTKSDIPILRIEQNGKQVWMPLISYQTVGDSSIATFMAPTTLEPGKAQLFLINDHDFSIPSSFTVTKELHTALRGITGPEVRPLGTVHIIGDGFVPEGSIHTKKAIDELETNIGYSKLSKADQWTALNRRVMKDWTSFARGNFLTIEQNGKKWRIPADGCGIDLRGMLLDYTLPPDLVAGRATFAIYVRLGGMDVLETTPIPVTVTP